MQKESISVYNPQDPLERAVQEAYHNFNHDWLFSYSCRLFARAISSMKSIDDLWLDSPQLMTHRISYFFSPFMSKNLDTLVFVTHLIFLRDILENNRINCFLHSPVVLMSRPIAHFLFREYPVHVFLDGHKVLEKNHRRISQIGGLFISEDADVDISDCIQDVQNKGKEPIDNLLESVKSDVGYRKVAASLASPGVFKIDEHKRQIHPGAVIWDKFERKSAALIEIEPGETGNMHIQYQDGTISLISKQEFDIRYFVT